MELDGVRMQRRYAIVIRGRVSDRLGAAFAQAPLERRPGETVLRGVADQARLEELLEQLRDLGLEPLRVEVEAR